MELPSTSNYTGPLYIDPTSFNASITSLLLFLGGEQYIDIFKLLGVDIFFLGKRVANECAVDLMLSDIKNLSQTKRLSCMRLVTTVLLLMRTKLVTSNVLGITTNFFRSRNISQETLMELSDNDLCKLGVDDPNVRAGIIEEVKNFPIYEEILHRKKMVSDLDLSDIATSLRDTNQHLHRIYLNMISTNSALMRSRDLKEDLIADKPLTFVITQTLEELVTTLDKVDNSLQTKFKCLMKNYEADRRKMLVGIVGTAVITVLSVLFVRSLSHAK